MRAVPISRLIPPVQFAAAVPVYTAPFNRYNNSSTAVPVWEQTTQIVKLCPQNGTAVLKGSIRRYITVINSGGICYIWEPQLGDWVLAASWESRAAFSKILCKRYVLVRMRVFV